MSYQLLRIYQASSGQWSGIVIEEGAEVARIAGCASPEEVEATAREQWDGIEVGPADGLRADGEPLCGVEAIDHDNTHPGNDNDASMGMAWWNALDETERRHWLGVAGTAVVADAWAAWKRTTAGRDLFLGR